MCPARISPPPGGGGNPPRFRSMGSTSRATSHVRDGRPEHATTQVSSRRRQRSDADRQALAIRARNQRRVLLIVPTSLYGAYGERRKIQFGQIMEQGNVFLPGEEATESGLHHRQLQSRNRQCRTSGLQNCRMGAEASSAPYACFDPRLISNGTSIPPPLLAVVQSLPLGCGASRPQCGGGRLHFLQIPHPAPVSCRALVVAFSPRRRGDAQ